MTDLQDEIKSLVSSLGIAKLRASNFVIGDDNNNEEGRSAGGESGQKEHPKKNKVKRKGKGKPDQQGSVAAPVAVSKSLLKKTKKVQRPDKSVGRPVKEPVDNKLTLRTQDVKESAGRKRRKGRRGKSGDDGSAVQVAEVSSSGDVQDGALKAADESPAAAPPTLWYTLSVTAAECSRISEFECSRLKEEADLMLSQDAAAYKRDGGGSVGSQWHWMQTVLTSGTIADKLAVRRTLLREAPAAHLHALEDTVRMVAARGKSHSMMAMGRLVEMFTKLLLPPGRTLKSFSQQPLSQLDRIAAGDPAIRRRQLVLWLFEDRLKLIYHDFVGKVREMAHDTVEKTRKHAVSAMTQLLISHPELEQTLLENLVNKLGDEKKAVGCLTVRKLSSLLRSHPAMRTVVVKEVERILFRPNVNKRVQFYGICFLSQVPFSSEGDEALTQRVIKVYIGFFKAGVKQAELDSRLMRALLGGLTSCVDSCGQLAAEQLQQYVEPLQHIAQLAGSFGVAVQALLLMFRLTSAGNTQPSDRFYSALYKKLVHPGMSGSPKVADFLNLVYRALSLDTCESRVRAFLKRLLQYCQHQNVELTCSVLVLIGELFRCRPELHRIEAGSQQNLSRSCWTADDDTDDDEERPCDVPLPEEDDEADQQCEEEEEEGAGSGRGGGPGWTFTSSMRGSSDSAPQQPHGYRLSVYTPLHRDPRWCRAELAPLHELSTLRRHYHPSAALFAEQLLAPPSVSSAAAAVQPSKPPYAGNPLQDFRLMHFLNRFCYRNPKKLSTSAADGLPAAAKSLTVSSAAYARLSESQVPGDELFFHRFFNRRLQQVKDLEESADVDVLDEAGDITDQAFDNLMQQWYGGSGKKKDKLASAEALDFASELASKAVDPREDGSGGSSAEEREEDVSAPPAGLMVDDSDVSDDGGDDDDMGGLFCDADDGDDDAEESDINGDDDAVHGKRRKSGAPMNTKRRKMSLPSDLTVSGDEFPVLPDGSETGNRRQSTSRAELRQLDWEEGKTRKPGRLTKRQDYRASSGGGRRPKTSKNAAGLRKH